MTTPLKCTRCFSKNIIKNGLMNNKQRYQCKKCNYNFTQNDRRKKISIATKKFAIQMYLEGLGFRSIERMLGISNVIVMKWVKKIADTVELLNKETRKVEKEKVIVTKMELDELWHYIGKKNEKRGSGLLLIETPVKSLIGKLVVVKKKQARSSGIG